MRRLLFSLLGVLCFCAQLLAQNRTVTGNVTDEKGNPIPSASVVVKGTSAGTTTDVNGNFKLSVPANAKTLVISSVGMSDKEVSLNSGNSYSVSLSASASNLQEVVVVGYTSTTKEAFTGTAKQVSGEELTKKSVSNVSQALAGEVAGVTVINTSGQPGSVATIRIRGLGSVNGNRSPLYVVDGVPFSGAISDINPEDIASVTVLKDAAATSIYGSRGANGVIVVTTKTGRSKQSFITADVRYGSNRAILPRYDVITSPEEYIELSWQAMYNYAIANSKPYPKTYANNNLFSPIGIDPVTNIWNAPNGAALIDSTTGKVRPGVTRKFDPERWSDYAFQPSNRTEANLQFGGGDNKTNYFTSFGYLNDVGYSVNSDYRRLSSRINLNHEVKSWLTTNFNLNYANAKTNNNGQAANSNSVFWFVDNIPSIYPLFLRDANGNKIPDPILGGYIYDYGSTNGTATRRFGSLTNAIADANLNTLRTIRNDVTGNTSATIKFTKNLSLENRLGMQYYNQDYWSRTNKFYGSAASQNGSIYQQKDEMLNLNLLNMLRYAKRFGSHNLELLAAHEATKYKLITSYASGYNLVDNNSLELANAIVINPTSSSYDNQNRLESYFGQANYNYENTYYLSGTIRKDGSSRFIKGNAWGTFGSVGAGWEVSRMAFMKNVKTLNYLKLKASYGVLGDQQGLGYYPGYTQISIGNLNNNPSFGVPVPGNPDLTWEESKMSQVGAEFRLGSFLDGSIDYYVKNTGNLVFQRRVGPSNGYALITVNDGELRNKGIEFELTGHILKNKNYYVDLGINGEHFSNKITTMPIDPSTGQPKVIDVQSPFAWAQGHSIFDYYIRNFAGVDPADGRSTWTVYYQDANGNKAFDAGEQVTDLEAYYAANPDKKGTLLQGVTKTYSQATQYYNGKSAIPDVRGAVNLRAGYKGFDFSIQMLYSFGGWAYDYAYAGLMANGPIGNNNWSVDIRQAWKNPGDITNVPRISNNATSDQNVSSVSTRFLTKANYITLNNIRFGYTLPSHVSQRIGIINDASLFVSGDNLWVHTARRGFNPSTAENGASDTYRYSPLSTITVGAKLKF
ncbi:MAG: SusC/RagA family TonB-linked outer membrane protein [Flavisolibacter sp.]